MTFAVWEKGKTMSKYDSQIHGVFAYFEGDEIRWHDFKEVGLDEPYYDWYYAEGRLYVIRDRIAEWYWFCYASSPKDAMEQFKEMMHDASMVGADYSDDAKEWLSGCPSADRPQGWIPCSERLPEEEGWYLVTIQNDKTEKRRTENDLFAIGIAEAHKLTPYKFCKDGHRQTVIAWMPLPEPYEGERKDNG